MPAAPLWQEWPEVDKLEELGKRVQKSGGLFVAQRCVMATPWLHLGQLLPAVALNSCVISGMVFPSSRPQRLPQLHIAWRQCYFDPVLGVAPSSHITFAWHSRGKRP